MRLARLTLLLTGVVALCGTPALAANEERVSELLRREAQEPIQVHPRIWLASANSNSYLVTTPAGAVVIDTGLPHQAPGQREALLEAAGRPEVKHLILTHAHVDHVGGARLYAEAGAELIASRAMSGRLADQQRLSGFRDRRARILWANVMPESARKAPFPEAVPDRLVDDELVLDVGGTAFHILATPGGEGPDGLSVWIPSLGALFIGDLCGPTQASFPNLFTLRGENLREAVPMMASIDRVLPLDAALLLPGHFEPLKGQAEIRALFTRTRDAVRFVHDATVAGMNEGKDLWTLMREVRLPPELEVSEQYGRVPWGVRAIWESYTGWFRYESTTELYEVPASQVHRDLLELIGGPEPLATRAEARLDAGRPLEALHLVEIAESQGPRRDAGLVRIRALETLLEGEARHNFQLAGWLRHRIAEARAALPAP